MRALTTLPLRVIGAALAGVLVFAVSAGAQAYDHRRDRDHDRWDRHHDYRQYGHHYDHRRYVHERPVYVRERPMVVERPILVAPPMMYQQPGPSGLNLNFNIPLN